MTGIRGDAVKRAAESFALAVAGKMLLTALEVYIDEEVRGASHERLSGIELVLVNLIVEVHPDLTLGEAYPFLDGMYRSRTRSVRVRPNE